ncbi:MAG: hypothetical protein H0X30_07950 [Anaerolineae bacterium]|nr:hypothetical protein [Anaerolineae bacterium]
MPDQLKPQNSAVVGEDGELIQADTTIDLDAYAEFVATYVHRDPLWFRIRNHIREYGYLYYFLSLPITCALTFLMPLFFMPQNRQDRLNALILLVLMAAGSVLFVYAISKMEIRE